MEKLQVFYQVDADQSEIIKAGKELISCLYVTAKKGIETSKIPIKSERYTQYKKSVKLRMFLQFLSK